MNINNYFDLLSQVRDEIQTRLGAVQAVLIDLEYFSQSFKSFSDGVRYGQAVQAHCELVSLEGKPTRKWAHATVYRDKSSGRYELTFYIL